MEVALEEYNLLVDRANRQIDEKKHKRRSIYIFAQALAAIDVVCMGSCAKSVTEYILLADELADENNSPCLSATDAVKCLCPELFETILLLKEHQPCQK